MKLPNGIRADIGTKLEDYVLNLEHPRGQHKARVFASTLGITLENAELLKKAIEKAAANSDEAVAKGGNGFGEMYVLEFELATSWGSATVLTAWVILDGEDFPRLTTCFIV